MSTYEIADLTGKRHDNVLADARKMLAELHGERGVLNFQDTYINPQNSQRYPVYMLPKREALLVVSGYSLKLRVKIIDRLQELEDLHAKSAADPMALLQDPATVRALLLGYADKVIALEHAVQAIAPKADALDRIATVSEGAIPVRAAANLANVPQGQFVAFLIEQGWVYRLGGRGRLMAMADKLRAGLVEMKRVEVPGAAGEPRAVAQTLITTRGLAKLAEMIERKAPHLRKPQARGAQGSLL